MATITSSSSAAPWRGLTQTDQGAALPVSGERDQAAVVESLTDADRLDEELARGLRIAADRRAQRAREHQ